MNLGDVKTRVKRQFGDESGVQITDDDITRWVNDGIEYIVMNNEGLLEKVDTIDLVENQQDYSFPDDLLLLNSLHLKTSAIGLSYVHVQSYDLQKFDQYVDGWDGTYYGTGTPYIYTVYAEKLRFFPIPDVSVTDGIKLFYNRKPTILTGEDNAIELDLPRSYHNGVVHYCLQQAYELDENMDSYTRKGADVQDIIRMNRYKSGQSSEETYPTITPIYDDAW